MNSSLLADPRSDLSPAELDDILAKADAGEPLDRADALRLGAARGTALLKLLATASALRDRVKGQQISYSRKVFVPLTNLCRDRCGYCTFVREPEDPKARQMTPADILAVVEAGQKAGCKEVLFSLGERPEARHVEARDFLAYVGHRSTVSYLKAMCQLVLDQSALLPHANPGTMSRAEVASLRDVNVSMGIMLESASPRLLEKGGPHEFAPTKHPKLRLATLRYAGEQQIAFTTGILIGIGETWEERVDSLLAIKDLHDAHGHIQEIIIQNFRAKDDIPMATQPDAGQLDYLRTIAMARLLAPRMNIQAPPNLSYDDFPLLLLAGINDWGGISPVTIDHINPEAGWPQIARLREASAESGYQLRERLAIYPEYLTPDSPYLPEPVRERALALAGPDGYARDERLS